MSTPSTPKASEQCLVQTRPDPSTVRSRLISTTNLKCHGLHPNAVARLLPWQRRKVDDLIKRKHIRTRHCPCNLALFNEPKDAQHAAAAHLLQLACTSEAGGTISETGHRQGKCLFFYPQKGRREVLIDVQPWPTRTVPRKPRDWLEAWSAQHSRLYW
jgi:hypothetical protein